MKNKAVICLFSLLAFCSFTGSNKIKQCYIQFKSASNLSASDPDRLPETSEKVRTLNTDNGDVSVSRIDGYRVLYNNKKGVPFVNLKVELSDMNSYEKDQKNILDNL